MKKLILGVMALLGVCTLASCGKKSEKTIIDETSVYYSGITSDANCKSFSVDGATYTTNGLSLNACIGAACSNCGEVITTTSSTTKHSYAGGGKLIVNDDYIVVEIRFHIICKEHESSSTTLSFDEYYNQIKTAYCYPRSKSSYIIYYY